jgi:AGZA family xanthine/uracil permease-like MFS transporter
MNTTTYGVGEMIIDAVRKGCRNFIVGIGGSATNDGGIGMLQALGFGMLDENGDPIDMNKAMACDSVATVAGSALGTSTCTTFVECASGVAAGARTGFASLVTSLCFLVCLFLTPLASIVPSCATAPALIFVGVLMVKNFANVDMKDLRSAVPAFLTLIMMPLTYSISNGIGIGCISYVLITLFTGKYTKKDIIATVIALLFIAKFAFVTM